MVINQQLGFRNQRWLHVIALFEGTAEHRVVYNVEQG
jgi:hypothetical protein